MMICNFFKIYFSELFGVWIVSLRVTFWYFLLFSLMKINYFFIFRFRNYGAKSQSLWNIARFFKIIVWCSWSKVENFKSTPRVEIFRNISKQVHAFSFSRYAFYSTTPLSFWALDFYALHFISSPSFSNLFSPIIYLITPQLLFNYSQLSP